jgi:transcription elongation factor Elf1
MNLAVKADEFKLVCERCGSLTVVLPAASNPASHAAITCGRCGAPRGTLSMLRERSLRTGSALE